MGLENFIEEALHQPNDYVAYHIGRELAKLHPEKAIIEGDTGSFDLEAFARAEKCAIVHETSLFNHIKTEWVAPEKPARHWIENSWLNVLWKGNLLDVVFVTFTSGCYLVRHHWIVADEREVADEFFAEVCEWSSEVRGEVLIFHDGEWMKNKELYESIKSATFDNLILRAGLKEEIQTDFAQFFASREVYERYRIPWKRGVLFIGPPGNGKTHTVKALVNQLARPCLYVKSFRSEYESDQENIRRVFARARATTPCFLVLEDVDSMIDDKCRSFFLNELDGFEANTGIVVVATTNYPEKLDPAILDRPSRFDRKYTFDLPGPGERAAYVKLWNNQLQPEMRLPGEAAEKIAQGTEGFSFAYLKELFLSSMMRWMADRRTDSFEAVVLEQRACLQHQMGAAEQTAREQASAASA
ncbi:MAG TPA: ATP-binding protein [Pyrinomonadaceae bacterium]|nr:ATP-binding protein [Pyrinomonadaceae bacterium]